MSESTYFKMVTNSNHSKPKSELEYLLFKYHDCWNVNLLMKNENKVRENIFKVIIYELNEIESYSMIEKIKKEAYYLNIDLSIKVINRVVEDNDIIHGLEDIASS